MVYRNREWRERRYPDEIDRRNPIGAVCGNCAYMERKERKRRRGPAYCGRVLREDRMPLWTGRMGCRFWWHEDWGAEPQREGEPETGRGAVVEAAHRFGRGSA